MLKRHLETYKTTDGFVCEIYKRKGVLTDYVYFAENKEGDVLLGGACCSCPEELKKILDLPR